MHITKEFLDTVGRRSPMARSAMVQAGDKKRIEALLNALVSIGACEITRAEIAELGLEIKEKRFPFTPVPLKFVMLGDTAFSKFEPLTTSLALEYSHMRNGVIGIREKHDA